MLKDTVLSTLAEEVKCEVDGLAVAGGGEECPGIRTRRKGLGSTWCLYSGLLIQFGWNESQQDKKGSAPVRS